MYRVRICVRMYVCARACAKLKKKEGLKGMIDKTIACMHPYVYTHVHAYIYVLHIYVRV